MNVGSNPTIENKNLKLTCKEAEPGTKVFMGTWHWRDDLISDFVCSLASVVDVCAHELVHSWGEVVAGDDGIADPNVGNAVWE